MAYDKLSHIQTFLGNMAVDVVVIQVLPKNANRTGFVLVNRTAGTIIYLGRSAAIDALSTSAISLLTNEVFGLMVVDGDEPQSAFYALASAVSRLDIVESVKQ